MKAYKLILFAIAVILAPAHAYSADLGSMRTTLIERDAYIYTEDSGEWQELRANYPIWTGDTLWTAQGSRVELRVSGGTSVRMDEETLLEVLEMQDDYLRLFIEEGRLYVNNERGAYEYIQVDSEYSSVRVQRGAVAMYDLAESGAASISVLRGYAHVQSTSGSVRVNTGSTVHVGYDLYADITPLGAPDEWERWNRDRDDMLGGVYASTRYLPEELNEYAYDFDTHGTWVYVRDYGYVWRPTLSVSISVGWAPYRHGHWRWRHGNYVWISYEPWGWGPYHYGRWANMGRLGWCWVPPSHGEVYWGPGYVGWVFTSSYVAWVPLAPYEIYYGYGYYGPYSINIIDIDINKTVIKNVYVNAEVKDAVTTVHRDTFLTGKEKPVRPDKPPKELFAAARGKREVGPPPDFRPDKEGKAIPRDMESYKPGAARERVRPEKVERKPLPPGEMERPQARGTSKQQGERPSPPGRKVERRAPNIEERPGRQGPALMPSGKTGSPAGKERSEPPLRKIEPEMKIPSRDIDKPGSTPPGRERGRATPMPGQNETGRERTITPPSESVPRGIETAPREKTVTPSPPGRTRESASPSVAPERRSAPSVPPGRAETPTAGTPREAPSTVVTPRGKDAPATPAGPTRLHKPLRPEVNTVPSQDDAVESPAYNGQGRQKDKERGKK